MESGSLDDLMENADIERIGFAQQEDICYG